MDAMETAARLLHANISNLHRFADIIDSKLGQPAVSAGTSSVNQGTHGNSFLSDTAMQSILNPSDSSSGGTTSRRFMSSSGVLNPPSANNSGLNKFGMSDTATGTGSTVSGGAGSKTDSATSNFFGSGSINNFLSTGPAMSNSGNNIDSAALSLLSAGVSKLEQKDGQQGAVEAVYFGDHFFGSEHDAASSLHGKTSWSWK